MSGTLLALLLLPSCGDVTADDGSCEATCLGMEDAALHVIGEANGALISREYRARCREAPPTTDCDACFAWIQETIFTPFDVLWDCGCGLTNLGVRQCRDNIDLDRAIADEALGDCLQTCKTEALDY